MPPASADREVAAIVMRQNGVVSRVQLVGCGLSRKAIAHRVAHGRLHRLHRGVFLLGHAVPPPLALETAALLVCGAGAVLSHGTAGHLWGLVTRADPLHVTLTAADSGPRPHLHVHRSPVPPDQVTRRHGLPLTTPAPHPARPRRDAHPPRARAGHRRRRGPPARRTTHLLSLIERSPGRLGAAALKQVLDAGPSLTRSEAEGRLLALTRAARLPRPVANVRLLGFEVDFLWPDRRLIVEVDGFAFHGSRRAFERDRRRDAELGAAGYRVLRLTWRRLTDEPEAVVADLARALVAGR